jgi:transposase
MRRQKYPSDINREQFEEIRSILESAKKITKPREIDLYDALCGVLYVLKSGCQWRMMPSDFPKWQSIYMYFRIWSKKKDDKGSILDMVLKKWLEKFVSIVEGMKKQAFVLLMLKV